MGNFTIRTFQNKEDFIKTSVDFITQLCKKPQKTFHIALSGGTTPQPIYRALSKKKLPFEKIEFFQVDERYISKKHPDSNQKMIEEVLINPLKKTLKAFHIFDTSLPIPETLKKYAEIIKKLPKNGFDLVILGIGPDGHTASLFPKTKALKDKKKLALHTTTKNFAIKDRLTLSFPALLKSKKILILLQGKEKKTIIDQMQRSTTVISSFPAKKLLEHPHLTLYYLDN